MAWKHNYEEMLDKAYEEIPESDRVRSRFEVPKFHGRIQGNKTILTNFSQISKKIRRRVTHLFKFMSRELATVGKIKEKSVIFKGKFRPNVMNKKLKSYVKEFVLCDKCGKPDTELITKKNSTIKKCEACGAENTVRTIK